MSNRSTAHQHKNLLGQSRCGELDPLSLRLGQKGDFGDFEHGAAVPRTISDAARGFPEKPSPKENIA